MSNTEVLISKIRNATCKIVVKFIECQENEYGLEEARFNICKTYVGVGDDWVAVTTVDQIPTSNGQYDIQPCDSYINGDIDRLTTDQMIDDIVYLDNINRTSILYDEETES